MELSSPDSIVRRLYEAISFGRGEAPNWSATLALFFAGARLVTPRMPLVEGVYSKNVEEWMADFQAYIERYSVGEFMEIEIASEVRVFRDIAHVFSAYESRRSKEDPEPLARGLNSFQLVKSNGRWWIVNVLWDLETTGVYLPEGFLPAEAD
jgi:hypothetical protein